MSEEEDRMEKNESIKLNMELLIKDQWAPVKELGKGQFGKVFHVLNIKDGREAAMKTEVIAKESLLKLEKQVMDEMRGNATAIQVLEEGHSSGEDFRFVIMTLCGYDLTKVSVLLNNKFSDSTIIRTAIRTLVAIKALHERGYVHRDLKPCNLALDYRKESHVIYLLDFGMARQFACFYKNTWKIRAPRTQLRFRGTLRYCSIRMHKRQEFGRCDDLWSWIFMIMEMRVELPWSGTTHPDKVEIQKTELTWLTMKKDPIISIFLSIGEHLNKLDYPDRPNYQMIYETLKQKLDESGAKMTDPMDFDAIRPSECPDLKAVAKRYNVKLRPPEKSVDEEDLVKMLNKTFAANKDDVPGGQKYVLLARSNFHLYALPARPCDDSNSQHQKGTDALSQTLKGTEKKLSAKKSTTSLVTERAQTPKANSSKKKK